MVSVIQTAVSPNPTLTDSYALDGTGEIIKWVKNDSTTTYYLRSTVFGSNILELDNTGTMSKEYVFSGSGSRIAFFKDNDVNWIHEEPSGKDRYELKQDHTATMKTTYDPTGAAVTNPGYSGGAACPPYTCFSGYNSQIVGAWTTLDGLEVLRNMRNQQRWQDTEFWNLQSFIDNGIIVGMNPPQGWNPNDNEDYIRHQIPGTRVIQGIQVQPSTIFPDGGFQYVLQFVSQHMASNIDVVVYGAPDSTPKSLPNCIKNYLIGKHKVNKDAVNSATFTRSKEIKINFTATGSILGIDLTGQTYTHIVSAAAFTWGYNIDFQENEFDPSNGLSDLEVELAGHEVVHTDQYRNDDLFTQKYLLNYVENLADSAVFTNVAKLWAQGISGIGDIAYRNINYEKEAKALQEKILKDIAENGNPCNPLSANGKKYNP
jgi:hypothetical protein